MDSQEHKKNVKEQFGRVAAEYAQWAIVDAGLVKSDVSFFEPRKTDLALDVACGPGTLSLKLAPLVAEVTGVDLTVELITIAEQKARDQGLPNTRFLTRDVEKLGFPDETFDLVVCGSALHHFQDPGKVFREMVRVCKRGGRVGIIDILAPEDDRKMELAHRIRCLRDPSHAQTLKASQMLGLFADAGLGQVFRRALARSERFRQWARTGGLEEGDPRYEEIRRLLEGSIEGDGTGWNVRRVGDDLEFDRSYFYACAVKPHEGR